MYPDVTIIPVWQKLHGNWLLLIGRKTVNVHLSNMSLDWSDKISLSVAVHTLVKDLGLVSWSTRGSQYVTNSF